MGEAINQAMIEENISKIAHTEIHKYLAQIIPFLEQRREVAKKYYQMKGTSEDVDKNYAALIEWNSARILEVLGILPKNQ